MNAVVDVVVPVRNGVSSIGGTVAAILHQSFDQFALYVVDDGSDDGTTELLRELRDDRLNLIRLDGRGPSAARNAGAGRGGGRWITFVDCEDIPDRDWLASMLSAGEEAQLVSCAADVYRGDTLFERRPPRPLGPGYFNIDAAFWPGMFMVRRALFETVGGYDEGVWFGENFELGMRLSRHVHACPGAVVAIHDRLLAIRQAPSGTSRSSRPERLATSAQVVLRKHAVRLAYTPRLLASYQAIAGVNLLRLGQAGAARRHLRFAIRYAPLHYKYWARFVHAVFLAGVTRGGTRSGDPLSLVDRVGSGVERTEPGDGPISTQGDRTMLLRGPDGAAEYVVSESEAQAGLLGTLRDLARMRRALTAIDPSSVIVYGPRWLRFASVGIGRRSIPGGGSPKG